MLWLYSAFLIGFLGSFHCVGMCGPIALALPLGRGNQWTVLFNGLLYNGGRIITYSILGLLFGFIGHTIAMAGFQKVFSILTGVSILLIVAIPLFVRKSGLMTGLLVRFSAGVKTMFRKLFGVKSRLTLFLIGAVNGLLPCGFVYLALAGASTAGSLWNGFAYMTLFGAGTVPMMLSLNLAGKLFSIKTQGFVRKISPVVAISLALLLIVRGIFLSPHACCMHH